jgi:hypothetical protein
MELIAAAEGLGQLPTLAKMQWSSLELNDNICVTVTLLPVQPEV